MTEFKDRLWRDLVREHGADLARISRPATRPRLRPRPRVLAGTTLGLTAAGTITALLLGATASTPAFAVTKNPDGTISVTIRSAQGIAGANAKLASLGVRAQAVPALAGCPKRSAVPPNAQVKQTPTPTKTAERIRQVLINIHARQPGLVSVAIKPGQIPAGKTLVLGARSGAPPRAMLLAKALAAGRGPCAVASTIHAVRLAPTREAGVIYRSLSCQVMKGSGVPGKIAPSPAVLHALALTKRADQMIHGAGEARVQKVPAHARRLLNPMNVIAMRGSVSCVKAPVSSTRRARGG